MKDGEKDRNSIIVFESISEVFRVSDYTAFLNISDNR